MPFNFNESGWNEFPIEQQQLSNWCWAACAVSISTFYEGRKTLTQPVVASSILNLPICNAVRPPIIPCNKTLDLGIALDKVRHLNGVPIDSPLSPNGLATALGRGTPVGCQMEIPRPDGRAIGHAIIVVSGKLDNAGTLFLRVADPSDGSINSMSFSSLRNNYRGTGGLWIRSYFTKA